LKFITFLIISLSPVAIFAQNDSILPKSDSVAIHRDLLSVEIKASREAMTQVNPLKAKDLPSINNNIEGLIKPFRE
jgi:hypothetical protein